MKISSLTPAAALPVLSVVSLVGTFVLIALGHPVTGLVETIDTVTLSAVAGAAYPMPRPESTGTAAATPAETTGAAV